MAYQPRLPIPTGSVSELAEWLVVELQRITEAQGDGVEFVILQTLHAEPTETVADMLVKADGTSWNPGSGAGLYQRNEANDAWVFIA